MNGMSKIVKTIAGISLPLSMIFGLYIIAHGHITPGGGFQGGAVVASALAMIVVAYGSVWTMQRIKEKQLSVLESIGAISFIVLALLGLLVADEVFFDNFIMGEQGLGSIFNNAAVGVADINTAGVIPLMNFAVGMKVIAGLFAIILVMAYATTKKAKEEGR